ncbi:MAG: hydroxymethylglutaryl-CoA reductase, degradative [Candidatus Thermoplasmatota archaeon]|jgi:hydroxymethylglutaryl-CoA reductase|nr:hydroxymethylglutaryl-CoA reductase, degradative [Candidatus Thermoplasmatota archaeon]MCL5963354.1 hydroxymethylglutaryl-CoA reductase, degradative [Candidatus Thermoplasmatota archaeon]
MVISNLPGFYELDRTSRLKILKEQVNLTNDEIKILENTGGVDFNIIDHMVENAIGVMSLPLGIATNFVINGVDRLIPMAVEETSVIAAASHAAKIARHTGGFKAVTTPQIMIGQIEVSNIPDINAARIRIYENRDMLLKIAAEKDPMLIKVGGGPIDINVKIIGDSVKPMMVVHLLVNTMDAMGANAVNTMVETLGTYIEDITKGTVNLRIISNLAIYRIVRAYATFPKENLARAGFSGEEVVDRIIEAYKFALHDPFRCATHNKGIMNGISAVVIATGNDFRAIEAGAHAYASYTTGYRPLTTYEKNENGDLVGSIEIPMAVGLIGGATSVHPIAKINVKIAGVKHVSELQEIIASVGLAQNFAALYALTTEGIQRGHMSLHARNIAISAGAVGNEIDIVAKQLVSEKKIRIERASEIIANMRKSEKK